MRIVYLSTDFGIPIHGHKGASIHVREMSLALAGLGHQVDIITCRAGGAAPPGFAVPVHELPLRPPDRLLVGSLQDDPGANDAVAMEVRSMLYAATLPDRALPLARERRPDAIYERYSLLGTAGIELARTLAVPHILEVNAPLSEEHARHRGIAFRQTIRAVERRVLAAADRVIAVSEPLKGWIVDTGVDQERVTVLPNGVNLERFAAAPDDARARLGLTGRPVVGFVGTLKGWHGTATLIRALGLLARTAGVDTAPALLIVGDGPQRAHLEQVAHDEGVAGLTIFTGDVAHDEVPAYLAAMDIAVAPYDETPGFYFSPLKLVEYMAAGKPVIAAAIGQITDCIRDGETGLLYPPGDSAALARCLADLVADPGRARALGRAAQDEARRHRGWSENARAVTDLIAGELAPRVGVRTAGRPREGVR